jgi:hypothetical protein
MKIQKKLGAILAFLGSFIIFGGAQFADTGAPAARA